jgi:RHS repeat-associated protein
MQTALTANSIVGFSPDQTFWRTQGSTPSSLLTDASGSTLALYDSAGTPVKQTNFTYEPYGRSTASVGSYATYPHQFTGRDQNLNTGLQYNRARYYAYGQGRFVSEDPIGLAGGSANPYLYAGGAPTVFTDPMGLFARGMSHRHTSSLLRRSHGSPWPR